uniref:Urease accessory protein UreF n=10 Tax=Ureaplasma urealyticum TaxID=2130 RepID=Q7BSE4_UREUR|nr:urease accessory protein UreF [Ureaplasma urealyticum]AAG10304.1 urease complex component UreF [Ureaplasma urealyticum serovar 2 str. ATCC 27814]AAG10314.1 urease complex component UreF [Ureaplasma urealyticum serovar 5 str. ATCC 27817]AAG10319.1 urease complex component UreF [Ureaplasma urealyticum serovar 7 str. ATCC 27819]AAG10324.1 urease complex component UreF [Ureaplasma urealyticum serovar 8 str. ATCC 27618]AAG10329.1 urease complex component UreF [Ureaplasma urealyticum serovar 9 st
MKEKRLNLKKHLDTVVMLNSDYLNLLDLMQITNANFPIGTFSHSFGIETYIRKDIVFDGDSLIRALLLYMNEQLLHGDLLAIYQIFKLLPKQKINAIWEIDQMINFQGLARETREGQRRIGQQMVKIYNELFDCELLVEYAQRIKDRKSYGNPAVAFALLAMHLKIDLKTALYTHLYSTVAALTQNCVRAIPLGQVKGQKIIHKLKHVYFDDIIDKVFSLDFKTDFCKNIPGLEIAQMEHEDTPVRLFMS